MERTNERTLLGVSIGHAAHDTWYGVAPVLLAALSSQMQLSNSEIGLVLLLYQAVSSLTQPFFGRLSERVGGRSMGVAAILWTTLMFSGVLFAPNKLWLALFIGLAGFGSGAWHPQGAVNATVAGGARWGATSASIFFLGGTLGSAVLGSALGGWLLGEFGRSSLLIVSAITVSLALFVVRTMVPQHVAVPHKTAEEAAAPAHNGNGKRAFWTFLGLLLAATAFRSLVAHSLNTYIPKYQQDLGVPPEVYGGIMSLFLIAQAVGGVSGSYLADRIGIRNVLVGTMVLGGLLFLPFVRITGFWSYASLIVSGFLIGPSHTLLVIAGQRQFPQRMAMASGIFLGFNFVSGAGGAWLLGLLADRISLGNALGILPFSLFIAAAVALFAVPGMRRQAAGVQRT